MNQKQTGVGSGSRRRAAMTLAVVMVLGLTAACGRPRMLQLSQQHYKPLEPGAKVDVYIGVIQPPYEEVAIIETDANAYVDNEIKKKQIEQLKEKARRLGANAVMNVRILSEHVRGATIDTRIPFAAWQQGQYELYFMRGTAIKVAEAEPSNMAEVRPSEGWLVEKLAPPPPLTQQAVPLPGLRNETK